ncbi:MAG: SDR family oxidoreductase [Caldilineaceae bacterium]
MKFQDKIVLITGGGTGVGEAAAAAFAAEGAQVAITGRRAEKLAQVCQAISAAKPVRYFAADMANRSQIAALVEWVNAELGPVDILVSNAGVNVRERKLAELSLENWDYIMNVNATGAYNIDTRFCRKCAPAKTA